MRRAVVALVLALAAASGRAEITVTPLGGESLAAGKVPTLKEVEGDFEDARYTLCLQEIDRALESKETLSGEDMYGYLSLKGECLLKHNQLADATAAFAAAAQAAIDKSDIALATATAEVLRHSENFAYVPLAGRDHKPLSILNRAQRLPALAALFVDQLPRTKRVEDAAIAGTDIQAVIDCGEPQHTLAMLELAATHGTPQTDALHTALTDRAHELVTAAITQLTADVDAIATSATQIIEIPASDDMPLHRKRRGLTDADRQHLGEITPAVDALEAKMKAIAAAYALDADFFKDDVTTAEALKVRVQKMLKGLVLPPRKALTR